MSKLPKRSSAQPPASGGDGLAVTVAICLTVLALRGQLPKAAVDALTMAAIGWLQWRLNHRR